jgi:hypothetical protein
MSDRDPKFTSKWWCELHRIMGTKLLMSMSFHPQMDEITERANRSIGQIFRAVIDPDQRDWVEKSPLIEFAINSSINSTTGLAPFEINNRYMPIMMKEVKDNERTPLGVRSFTQNAIRNMAIAHNTLIEARVFQKMYADKKQCSEPEIKEGDMVYLSTKKHINAQRESKQTGTEVCWTIQSNKGDTFIVQLQAGITSRIGEEDDPSKISCESIETTPTERQCPVPKQEKG